MTCEKLEAELQEMGDRKYLYGNTITELDTLIYGHLKAIKNCYDDGSLPELWKIMEEYPYLRRYLDFIQKHVDDAERGLEMN